jgi:predicted negative regulator of RcsB-dependent stress response
MDDQIGKEILEELRKQTQYVKKTNTNNLYTSIIVLIIIGGIFFAGQYFSKKHSAELNKERSPSWSEVRDSLDKCDYAKALDSAKFLTERSPKHWYGYSYLGSIYTALGDTKNAELNYLKAYELFPTKDNKENLDAIRACK